MRAITFRDAAERYLIAHEAGWKNFKHRNQWANTLETYAFPVMRHLPVTDLDWPHVLAVWTPIWHVKPETASRVRGRIVTVLGYAQAHEWRPTDKPVRWPGPMKAALLARAKVAPVKHHAALPWQGIGAFLAALRLRNGIAPHALEFAILTTARTGEVLGATWGEVDLSAGLWIVPSARMKAGKLHRVPLSAPALAVLADMAKIRLSGAPTAPIFPGTELGRPLSNMALAMVLRRIGQGEVTVHGFQSCFRDWAGETTAFPADVVEAALAHALGDKTVAAYARGDLMEKRRRLMEVWGEFCDRDAPERRYRLPGDRERGREESGHLEMGCAIRGRQDQHGARKGQGRRPEASGRRYPYEHPGKWQTPLRPRMRYSGTGRPSIGLASE